MRRAALLFACLLLTAARDVRADEVATTAPASVVRVNVTNQSWDFARPWGKRPPFSRRATGTILSENRVLVTAELVKAYKPLALTHAVVGDQLSVWQLETTGTLLVTKGPMTTAEVTRYPID